MNRIFVGAVDGRGTHGSFRHIFLVLFALAACTDAEREPTITEEERGWVRLPDDGPPGYMIRENDLSFAVYCSDGHVFHMVSSPEQPFSIDDGFYMGSLAGTLSDWGCNEEGTLCATVPPASPRVRDEIIMFSPLTLEQMEEIVVLQMKEVQDRLNEHNITVQLTDAARKWLAKEGYDPAFGARPLRRAIQKNVESPLSMELLANKFKDGAAVTVDVDEKSEKIVFHTAEPVKKKSKQHAEA